MRICWVQSQEKLPQTLSDLQQFSPLKEIFIRLSGSGDVFLPYFQRAKLLQRSHSGRKHNMSQAKYCPQCKESLVTREIDGKSRLACPSGSCGYVFWDNPTPVVAAVVEHNGAVVLVRNKGWPEKIYGLLSGFLEKNETPETAILREVKEEIGLDAKIESLIGIYSFFQMNQLIVAYHISAQGEIKLGDELAGVKSVPPERLKPWPFGTGIAVRDWLERRKTS